MPNIPGKGTDLRLNSPWDVTIVGNNLYVAVAGPHQIWRLGIKTLMAEPWGGSDREDLEGARLKHAALAQPSRITCIDDALYVADSEISAPWASPPQTASCISRIHNNYRIKTYSLETAKVHTIAGTGTPGNTDGKTLDASFNEPSGLAIYRDKLYIADTNNHAIRVMSLDTDIISTLDVR